MFETLFAGLSMRSLFDQSVENQSTMDAFESLIFLMSVLFVLNQTVCNDIAERGVHLMTDFINKAESEEQREALFQCVEYHRNLVKGTTKEYLKLC